MLDPITAAWFAGLYEGDGTVGGSATQIRLTVATQDEEVANLCIQRLKIGHINIWHPTLRNKSMYAYNIGIRSEVISVAMDMWPHLTSKRKEQIRTRIRLIKYDFDHPF